MTVEQTLDPSLLIRHRLDQLGYASYGIQDIQLIGRLVSDLISATEAAKQCKQAADLAVVQKETFQLQLDPLRAELAKITAENNKLHSDFCTQSTTFAAREKRAQQILKQSQADYSELLFVNSQLLHNIDTLKQKGEADRLKMEESMLKAGILSEKPKTKQAQNMDKLFQKLQKIDIETGLLPMTNVERFPAPDPIACDLVKLSEQRVDMIEKDAKQIKEQNGSLENEANQVIKRDQEIKRIGIQLEIARAQQWGGSAGTSDPTITSSSVGINDLPVAKRRIDQLEQQIELLQEHVESLEAEVAGFQDEKKLIYDTCLDDRKMVEAELSECKSKNNTLVRSLAKLENMVKDFEALKTKSPTRGTKKTPVEKAPIAKNVRKIAEVEEKYRLLQEKLEKNSSRLAAANSEQEKLKQKNVKLKSTVENLEAALQDCNSRLAQLSQTSVEQSKDAKISDLELENAGLRSQLSSLKTQLNQQRSHQLNNHQPESQTEELRHKLESSLSARAKLELEFRKMASNLAILDKDRQALISMLSQAESTLSKATNKISLVSNERDSMELLYKQVLEQLTALRESHSTHNRVPSSTVPVQTESWSPVREPRTEIEDIAKQFKILHQERDSLAESNENLAAELKRVKSDLEATVFRQQETGASAVEALRQLETERDGLIAAFDSRGRDYKLLEDNYNSLEKHVERLKSDIVAAEKKEDYLKGKVRQLEMERDKEVFQTRQIRSRAGESEAQLERAKSECERVRNECSELEEQVKKQRDLLDRVDRERDAFQMQMDQKDVDISELIEKNAKIVEEKKDLERELFSCRSQLESLDRHLSELEQENANLQGHLHAAAQERDLYAAEAQRNGDEVRNVASDLTAVSNENQNLHAQLSDISGERDQLKIQLAECERYINNLEDTVGVKDMERDNLVTRYRKLISEFEKLDIQAKNNVDEINNLRMEAILRDKRVQQLLESNDELSKDYATCKVDRQSIERECSQLSRSLDTAQRTIANLEKEKNRMMREITTAKEFAMKLDLNKDDLQKQLLSSNAEIQHQIKLIEKLENENEAFANLMKAEAVKMEKLEKLLVMERTKNIHNERDSSEDVEVTRRHFEQREHAMQTQHNSIMASLTKQLNDAKDEIAGLNSRIQFLTKTVDEQKRELASFNNQLDAVKNQLDEINIIESLPSNQASSSRGVGTDQKIQELRRKIEELTANVDKRTLKFGRVKDDDEQEDEDDDEEGDYMMSMDELNKAES